MPQVPEQELLVVVRLLLVDVEVSAVKVKQTVRELVTGERPHDKLTFIPIEHATARQAPSNPWLTQLRSHFV